MTEEDPGQAGAPDSVQPPKQVRRMAASIQQAAGRAPEITRPGATRWQVALTGRRVAVTVDFTTSPGGKTRQSGTTLTVNGKRRPPVPGPAAFGQLWHKLEDLQARAVLRPVPPLPAGKTIPLDVRLLRDRLTSLIRGQPDISVETGYEMRTWVVGVTIAPERGLRLILTQHGSAWGLHALQVIRDGRDLSAQAGQDLAAAVALLAPPPDDAPAAGPGGTLSRGARDPGVETRRRVVIREYRRAAAPGPAQVSCLRELTPGTMA
jgi:hypothetical protein